MPETTAPSLLDRAGAMSADYRHIGKRMRSSQTLLVGGACLKWYDVAPEDAPVEEHVQALARDRIAAESRAGRLAIDGELGFVILHRCGGDFYFLQVCTWRNHNEIWETVYAKDGADCARVRALARRRPPPAHLLRVGAGPGHPRAGRLEPVPALAARPGGAAGLHAGRG